MARENWFKDSKDQIQERNTQKKKRNQKAGEKINTSTVMFVPSTRNGVLIKALKEAETEISKLTRFQVRYQEAGGIQLARLFSTDLGKGSHVGERSAKLVEDCQE